MRLANTCLLAVTSIALLGDCRFDPSGVRAADGAHDRQPLSDKRSYERRQPLDERSEGELLPSRDQNITMDRDIPLDRSPTANCTLKFGAISGFTSCGEVWNAGIRQCQFQYTSVTATSCDQACLDWHCVVAYASPSACTSTQYRDCQSLGTDGLCTCQEP